MGTQVPSDRQAMERQLGAGDSVFPISGGDPACDLHDQRSGVVAHESAQDHQDAGIVSERGSGDEAAVPGVAERGGQVGHAPALEAGDEPLSDAVGRTDPGGAQSLGTDTIRETRMIAREDQKSPAAARNLDLPLSRFPLRGQAGAGGFPPRRSTSRASQRRWHAPCAGSPHKRGCRPLVDPLLRVACIAADANNESLKEKIIGAVYTKYLTLPRTR